jgi:DNA-binding transcriptional LysR family regulator
MRSEDVSNFVIVAQSASLVVASQKLGVSQPTLSKSIARLERALGEAVIERLARGVRLTEAGRAFLVHSQRADLSLADGISAVRDLRHGRSGTIRLGVGIGVPKALIAKACGSFMADRHVSLEISTGMSDSLTAAVLAGEVDLVVSGVRPSQSVDLAWTPLFDDPMIPVAAAAHALVGRRSLGWETLAEQKWLVPTVGTTTRTWFDQQFAQRGLTLSECVVSLRNYYPALELGSAMGAISLVPASLSRKEEFKNGNRTLRVPADWVSDRIIGMLYRRDGYLSAAARQLIDSLERTTAAMFAAPASRVS